MKKLKGYEIRQMWLDFFKEKEHMVIPSAPLVPINDPSLLWINAGIAPLKKYFDGREIPVCRRMVNAQKSIRTNDIENVGKTARHHTFFEMLGNFSVGDYFKDEALTWGFEILTSPKWFGFDLNKLYFTVYPSDEETIQKWLELGVDSTHIIKLPGNFWEIGEGPCGPDTEIFYDRGEKYDINNQGINLLKNDIENDRYIEIWNIVFSQFNAEPGKKREEYQELPSKNIDTGMGLERMACVMQEVETNYDTDLFLPIINKVENLTKVKYDGQMAFKVIADHLRSVVFAVADGAILSNEGRGYVLRRILRRAVRFGKKLGMNEPFLYKLVDVVAENMSHFYPYLLNSKENVKDIIKIEEEKFLHTLESGENKLLEFIQNCKNKEVSGDVAFLLYDTFGFPFELTLEVAEEQGFIVDKKGFLEKLEEQKERARGSRNEDQSMNIQNVDFLNLKVESEFLGYEQLESSSVVKAIFSNDKQVNKGRGELLVVFDQTPMYGLSGGQVGDLGTLYYNNEAYLISNTIVLPNKQHASFVDMADTELKINDKVVLVVNKEFRQNVARNHSATHLLNESLRRVLGNHVTQQGSMVSEKELRFDFNNYKSLTDEELLEIERLVNKAINDKHSVKTNVMAFVDAKKEGVQAVFTDKYEDYVRVVNMEYSKELCGGTHVENTGDILGFVILNCETKGSGIFRITGATGNNIKNALKESISVIENDINDLQQKAIYIVEEALNDNIILNYNNIKLSDYVPSYKLIINRKNELSKLQLEIKELEKTYEKFKRESNKLNANDFLEYVIEKNGFNYIIMKVLDQDNNILKDLIDSLSDKLKNSIVFFANIIDNKVVYICKNKTSIFRAGDLVKKAAVVSLGNGGGRADFAQSGGKDITKVDDALQAVKNIIEENI
ncbi:MAG: alanine--tRNA ligase [Bacilli bacterium]|jgi:alanyl-tRNA synthetase|nr:alanine--tRNA ligase [Bacilli bacterium]MDD3121438.1 alanine--tRNA ligase [Bacilli bacterium]MDY0363600.1 alanine--tRNA ligase [Bacilli bacterium]